MCWRLVLASLLGIGVRAFSPAPIRWCGHFGRRFVLAPKFLPSDVSVPTSNLAIWDLPGTTSSNNIAYFTANPDKTITVGGLCVEANADAVRINRCNAGPAQLWNVLLGRYGHGSQFQLQQNNKCIAVSGEGVVNGAPVKLQECNSQVTELWEFEESLPLPTQGPLQRPVPSTWMRHVVTPFMSIFALGALSLGAWIWPLRRKVVASRGLQGGTPLDLEQAGVSLGTALDVSQCNEPFSSDLNTGVLDMVPAALVISADSTSGTAESNSADQARGEQRQFYRFVTLGHPVFEEYAFDDTTGYACKTPEKFEGTAKHGTVPHSSVLQFTLPDKDDDPKTVELLHTQLGRSLCGAVKVRLPVDATVVSRGTHLVVKDFREGGNTDSASLMKGDIIRAVSYTEDIPAADEGMLFLDGSSEAAYDAALNETLRVKGEGAEAVFIIERPRDVPEGDAGKFVRAGTVECPDAFGPLAVVVGGFDEDRLELVDEILEAGTLGTGPPPVIVLAEQDRRTKVKDLLENRFERDHVLPSRKSMDTIRPFIMFSGLPISNIRNIMGLMNSAGVTGVAVCAAVPKGMNKPISQLTEEVVGDFLENQPR